MAYACLVCGLIASANLLETVLALLLQIRLLLHLGLVEAVDNVVLPLRNEDTLDLALVLEAYLPHVHGAILLEIGPWCVDDGDVVLLVA